MHTGVLQDIDWGIAVTYDGVHFTTDPSGVLQLDSANATGSPQSWDASMASCTALGKRMSGGSALKALREITGAIPTGFSTAYWSSTVHPSLGSTAYGVTMSNGNLGTYAITESRHVRCGI